MIDLFAPVSFGNLKLRNRFMRSATAERLSAPDGTPGAELAALAGRLAQGGVGLIVLGHTFVRPDGKASMGMSGLWRDEQMPAFACIAAAAHGAGAAIAVQINHGGRQANPQLNGGVLLAPSAIPASESAVVPRELDEAQIEDLVEAYGQAAKRVREAGFDAVQIHAAHGYLIGQFLSPASNKRQDEWGGSLENRARFLRRVAERVRRYVGPDYPVMVKLGLADFISGGMPLEDGLAYVGMLESMGINLLEISGGAGNGNIRAGITRRADEAYFLPWARQARSRTRLPIALVGGLRSLAVMQAVVDEGAADLISLSRPLIREPDLVMRLAAEAQDRASCISCMSCSRRSDLPTRCWQVAGTNAQEAN